MSADGNGNNQQQGGGGILESLGCADCLPGMGFVTRALLIEGVIGAVLSLTGLGAYTVCCAAPIIDSYGLQFYRLFVSWVVGSGLIGSMFCLFTIFQLGRQMEESRGSFWFGATFLQLSLLTNLVVLALGLVLGSLLGVPFFLTSVCASGLWPAAFGLMVLDCMATPDEERRIMCFPCQLASKFHPLLLLLLFTLLVGLNGGMVIGTACGYLLHYRPSWQLSLTAATRWEANPKLAFLTQRDGFRHASNSGVQAMGGGAWGGGGGGGGGGGAVGAAPSSRFATVHGPSAATASSAAASASAAPSVFSGPGHRLGGSPPAASGPSSLLSFSNPFASSSSSAPAAVSVSAPSDPAALEAARRQRAAAFDKRTAKPSTAQNTNAWIPKQTQQHQGGAAAGTAAVATSSSIGSSSGNAIAPPSVELSNVVAPSLQRPPSPSGQRSSAQRAPSVESSGGLFSLGLDDDDDSGAEELDDDLEQQQQGFVQGGAGGGKAGYAAVDIGGEEDHEAQPSNSADPDDNATERTSLHTQR